MFPGQQGHPEGRYRRLLVGDSIVRPLIKNVAGLEVRSFSGAKVQDISSEIDTTPMGTLVKQADVIISHVGTNNLCKEGPKRTIDRIKGLLTKIRGLNPTAIVGFSCILPRPRDEGSTMHQVKKINGEIMAWSKQNGYMCLRSFSPVSKGNRARRPYFLDGLHLNQHGVEIMVSFYSQQLSNEAIGKVMQQAYNW